MAYYNSNAAREVTYVYQNNKLTAVSKELSPKIQERKAYIIVAKVLALVLSVAILSSVYVYSHATLYAKQAQINTLEETLDFNKSNYTQSLTKFNNFFTEEYVRNYATKNLGFSSANSNVTYINSEDNQVQVYK